MGAIGKLKKRVALERERASREEQKKSLRRELFALRNRKSISALKSVGRGIKKTARGVGRVAQYLGEVEQGYGARVSDREVRQSPGKRRRHKFSRRPRVGRERVYILPSGRKVVDYPRQSSYRLPFKKKRKRRSVGQSKDRNYGYDPMGLGDIGF
jgi:hypothetical protein